MTNTNNLISAEFELYDERMDHLLAGTPYYVYPADSGRGGVMWSYEENSTCYAVRQAIDDLPPNKALIFNHAEPQERDWLVASKDLNIKYEDNLFCDSSSTVLQVNNVDEATGKHFITTGGVEGNPGCGTVNSWFQIEKVIGLYTYKFVYCPSAVCDLVDTCKDVGLFRGAGGFQHLVLSDDNYPMLMRFVKANPCPSNVETSSRVTRYL
ncbi:miraculin-like [Henckelia pumila]|uniref:miraculin-like n=1 Tax=Henckelia pumila TaxID=405737 RepID=UPI003C6E743E